MQNRRWPRDVFRVTLFCAALALIALAVNYWSDGEACYNSLRSDMPEDEAITILESHGYKRFSGPYRMHTVLMGGAHAVAYSRGKADPPIVLIVGASGTIGKERESVPQYVRESFRERFLRW